MRIVSWILSLLLLGLTGCGDEKPGADSGPPPDRGVFEGPVTKKDPDQGPVPDWVLALREASAREAAPLDAAPSQ
jgi:hypothetical protein